MHMPLTRGYLFHIDFIDEALSGQVRLLDLFSSIKCAIQWPLTKILQSTIDNREMVGNIGKTGQGEQANPQFCSRVICFKVDSFVWATFQLCLSSK